MSGCNCKNNNQFNVDKETKITKRTGNYIFRFLVFLFSLITLPIILIIVVWFMFKLMVLNENFDITKIISYLTKLKNSNNDDNDGYIEGEEYELIDFDHITSKNDN